QYLRNDVLAPADQQNQLELLQALNREHQARRREEAPLEARIQSFELASRMQLEATEAFDLEREPESVRKLYGPGKQAQQLILARRLVERGVRFVQVWTGLGIPGTTTRISTPITGSWRGTAIRRSRACCAT